jgi:hypothetical protein
MDLVDRRRLLLVIVLWTGATAFGLAFADFTKVGPVVLTLGRGHGVHVGDLLALCAVYAPTALMSRRILRRRY